MSKKYENLSSNYLDTPCTNSSSTNQDQACIVPEGYKNQPTHYDYSDSRVMQSYLLYQRQLHEYHQHFYRHQRLPNSLNDCESSKVLPKPNFPEPNRNPENAPEQNQPVQVHGRFDPDDVNENDWLEIIFKIVCIWFLTVVILVNVTLPRVLFIFCVILITLCMKSIRRNRVKRMTKLNLKENAQDTDVRQPSLFESFSCFVVTFFTSLIPESLPAT